MSGWEDEYFDLMDFFKSIDLPEEPIQFDQCSTITDVRKYLRAHFKILQAQNGNKAYLPYLKNLQTLKKILENDRRRNKTATTRDSKKPD